MKKLCSLFLTLAFILVGVGSSYAVNGFYNHTSGYPGVRAPIRSAPLRAEFDAVADAFTAVEQDLAVNYRIVSDYDYSTLIEAVADIGSTTPTKLLICQDNIIADSQILTQTSNITFDFTCGGTIDGILGGGVENLSLGGPIITTLTRQIFKSNLVVSGGQFLPCTTPQMFGAIVDDSTADTSAIQSATNLATTANHIPVYFPVGHYITDGPVYRHEGIMLIGQSPGATGPYGVWIYHKSTSDLFVCDGNGRSVSGVGGGFKNISIQKQSGYLGGVGIKYLATDESHRPGEEFLENILVFGTATGLWDMAIEIDGTACDISGSRGVRQVVMHKVRVADCQTAKKSIYINQGTAVTGTHVEVDVGDSVGDVGLTIDGTSSYTQFTDLIIAGYLVLEDEPIHSVISGHIQYLEQNTTTADGTFTGSISMGIVNKSLNFKVISDTSPAFQAIKNSNTADVTGDGTDYTIIYNLERYDINSNYDNATGIFTATCAGVYTFHTQVTLSNITSGHTRGDPYLLHKSSAGVEQNATDKIIAPYAVSSLGYASYDLYFQVQMNYGDTVESVANVKNSTKTVGIYGTSGAESTFFEGHLQ